MPESLGVLFFVDTFSTSKVPPRDLPFRMVLIPSHEKFDPSADFLPFALNGLQVGCTSKTTTRTQRIVAVLRPADLEAVTHQVLGGESVDNFLCSL